jgi:hypothetical protein
MKHHLLLSFFLVFTLNLQAQVFHRVINATGNQERGQLVSSSVTGNMTVGHLSGDPATGFYYYITDTSFNLLHAAQILAPQGVSILRADNICDGPGNSFIACFTVDLNLHQHLLLLQIQGNGTLGWSRIIGDTSMQLTSGRIARCSGGYTLQSGAIISNNQTTIFARLDTAGNLQWVRTAGTGLPNVCAMVEIPYPGGGYICSTRSDTCEVLIRLDTFGSPVWSKKYFDDHPSLANPFAKVLIRDSVIYASPYGSGLIYSFSMNGAPLQAAAYDNVQAGIYLILTDLDTTSAGLLMTGFYGAPSNPYSAAACEVRSDGGIQWSRSFYETAAFRTHSTEAIVLPGNSILLNGYIFDSIYKPYCAKVSPAGWIGCDDLDLPLQRTAIYVTEAAGPSIYPLIVLSSFTTVLQAPVFDTVFSYCFSTSVGVPEQSSLPAPEAFFADGNIHLSFPQTSAVWQVELFNLNGEAVRSLESKEQSEQIGASGLAVGIYLLRMSNGTQVISQKILLTQ